MRSLCYLGVLLCAMSAWPAYAQVALRSGEHDGFTRVVAQVTGARAIGWAQRGRSITLSLSTTEGFDAARVFDRIPRLRISEITARGQVAQIDLACDCPVDVYLLDDRTFVLDVRDRGRASPKPDRARDISPSAYAPGGRAAVEEQTTTSASSNSDDVPQELLRQLSRAIDQGYLDVADQSDQTAPVEAPQVALEELITALQDVPGVRASTALDTALPEVSNSRGASDRANCPEDAHLNPTDWAGEADFTLTLADLRAQLLGEFDSVNPEAVENLAAFYIAHGLGDEAINLLQEFPNPSRLRSDLGEVASLFATPPAPDDHDLGRFVGCSGWGFIWALARGVQPDAPPAAEMLKDHFSKIPAQQRDLFGDPVVTTLLDAGYVAQAEALQNVLSRSGVLPSPRRRLNLARLTLARGETGAARAQFAEIARGRGIVADQALLYEARLARLLGEQTSADRLTDLETLAVLHKGSDLGTGALTELVLQTASTGDLRAALDVLERATEAYSDDAEREMIRRVIASTPLTAESAATYVEAILARLEVLSTTEEGDATRLKVARDFLELGLPHLTLQVLSPSLARGHEQARVLAARAQLSRGHSGAAADLVEGVTGDEAEAIRALAAASLSQPDLAQTSFAPTERRRTPVAPKPLPSNVISLSEMRQLLDRSTLLRTELEDQLEATNR
ncbi:MAG: hypothetical protein AAFQ36_08915 [Pseudomonadota bacterium]